MLKRLANIFRVPDLRNKVLFTVAIICLYQLGANLPIPGVSWSQVQLLQSKAGASGVLGFLNLFSGGALTRLAVFGLGVMPYITSSIVIQLLTTVIPKLTEWRDQGAVGQKKITQTTRYLTIGLALLQSTGLIYAFHGHDSALLGFNIDLIPKFTLWLGSLHGHHHDRGHGVRHVARRAHHPARRRPGHEPVDLRQRRRGSALGRARGARARAARPSSAPSS